MQVSNQIKRKQAGFIQNFIIPGIILIGVVIAGIAMLASNSGGTDTSNEKASMLANSVIGMGLTVSSAIQRAEADGSAVGADMAELVSGKYLTALPALPQGIKPPASGSALSYSLGVFSVLDGATPTANNIGTASKDDVLFVALGDDSAANLICNRINNKLTGSASNDSLTQGAATADAVTSKTGVIGVTEGCYADGAAKTYYKVVNAK